MTTVQRKVLEMPNKIPLYKYDDSKLMGMELTLAVKTVVDEMVAHYNKYFVEEANNARR